MSTRNAEASCLTRLDCRLFVGRCLVLAICALLPFAVAAQWSGLTVGDARGRAGAEVGAVVPGSAIAAAGLKPGDVIIAVQGQAVATAAAFRQAVQAAPPGTVLTLRVSRDGWERDMQVEAGEAQPTFGLALADDASGAGVAIASVAPGSAAATAGLQPGDRIVRLGAAAVPSAQALRKAIDEHARRRAPLVVTVERGGWSREVTLVATAIGAPAAPGASSAMAAGPATASLADAIVEANRQYDAGNWRQAEAGFLAALKSAPDDARVWGRLCHAQVMQERFAEALETCRRATELGPREPSAFQNVGYALARLKRPAEALPWYRRASDIAPDWAIPYDAMGGAHLALGNWPAAEEQYRLAVARDGKSASTWQGLGDACSEQRKLDEAIVAYRRALDLGGDTVLLQQRLGMVLYDRGRIAEAEPSLLEANRLDPRDPRTLVALGLVEEKLGKSANARQAWQRAADLDPSGAAGAAARQNLARAGTPPPSTVEATPAPAAPRGDVPIATAPGSQPPVRAGDQTMAAIAVGDFQVKAANAGQYVGEGLREMLLTALYQSGKFAVVERMDLKGLTAEQALSRSRMARPGEAIPEGEMEVADLMVYGAVTEFEPEVRGGGLSFGFGNLPLNLGVQSSAAHMAIDVRIVDVASGRVLATTRLTGEARSAKTSIGVDIRAGNTTIPASLGGFQNTPMEQAIRECIGKATTYIAANTPATYFHHR